MVGTDDYNKLTTFCSPSKEHIEEKAQSAGLVVVPKDEYEKLLESQIT